MRRRAFVAFEGGGALGLAHLGAWLELAHQFDVIGTAGTSAGAIVAALCATRYPPEHAIDLFTSMEWPEYVRRRGMLSLLRDLDGWSDGEEFYQWLRQRMGAYLDGAPETITFSSLAEATGGYLAIVATDLNDPAARPVIFDVKHEPHTDISFAVRASISIPGVFTPVRRRDRGQVLVDGGVLLNFPGQLLLPMAAPASTPLIGVRFNRPQPELVNPRIMSILRRTIDVVSQPGNLVPPDLATYQHFIDVPIDVSDFDSLDFNLTSEQKRDLLERGVMAARMALTTYELRLTRLSHVAAQLETVVAIAGPVALPDSPPAAPAPLATSGPTYVKSKPLASKSPGTAKKRPRNPTSPFHVRGRAALSLWAAFLTGWLFVDPEMLDADFPLFAFAFAATSSLLVVVFSRPWTLNRLRVVPLAKPVRILLIAMATGMLMLWALGFRLLSVTEHAFRVAPSGALQAQKPGVTTIDVAEGTSAVPRGQGFVVCIDRTGFLSGADFVFVATGGLTTPERDIATACVSVDGVVASVRPSQVMIRGTFARRGVAQHSFNYGGESFDVALELQSYFFSRNIIHASIERKPLPTPPPPPPPPASYCTYIVFERIAADDDNSKNRKTFVIRLTDGTPTNDYRAELPDSRLPSPSVVIVKDLPRKKFGVTISFKFRDTNPRATLNGDIDLSATAEAFRGGIDFDRGLNVQALSNDDYVRFIGSRSIDAPNCGAAPKGLSWR